MPDISINSRSEALPPDEGFESAVLLRLRSMISDELALWSRECGTSPGTVATKYLSGEWPIDDLWVVVALEFPGEHDWFTFRQFLRELRSLADGQG